MDRRSFLAALVAVGVLPRPGAAQGVVASTPAPVPAAAGGGATLYIPGYWPDRAVLHGMTADRWWRKMKNHGQGAGQLSLLTRIGPDGAIRQAVFPVQGHDVEIAPDRKSGFFGRMDYGAEPGAAHHVAFDPETLEQIGQGRPPKPGWRGGGHGVHAETGDVLLTTERAPLKGYAGHPEAHYGLIAVRDPVTLKVLDTIPCHGIDPHEIRLLPGGRQAAVANYGSVAAPGRRSLEAPRDVVEASVTIVDLASGALVEKHPATEPGIELRHLTVTPDARAFAIRVRLGQTGDDRRYLDPEVAEEADITADPGQCFLPATPLLFHAGTPAGVACGDATVADLMRHGLSVKYDADHAEVIATFPSAQRVMVFDAETGALKRAIDTAALGLRYPCGLALLPDGVHYAVTGYWQGLFVFTRGAHEVQRELCHYPMLFGHSHIAAV